MAPSGKITATLSSATLATVKSFVAAPVAAKTLLVIGSDVASAQVAAAIAADLKRDVVRVALSTVVSKDIGETEKHLDRVFASAAKGDVVLFFDEGDALLGKRTDVKDSHDRHANVAADSLLQRIESHAGVAILATRTKGDLDEPFLRRLRATATIELPH